MLTAELKTNPCPVCGKLLNAASCLMDESCEPRPTPHEAEIASRGPRPGDLTVCLYCANIFRFTKKMELAPVTAAEMAALRGTAPETFAALMKVKLAAKLCIVERAERN
jgi:hypothetical protein